MKFLNGYFLGFEYESMYVCGFLTVFIFMGFDWVFFIYLKNAPIAF